VGDMLDLVRKQKFVNAVIRSAAGRRAIWKIRETRRSTPRRDFVPWRFSAAARRSAWWDGRRRRRRKPTQQRTSSEPRRVVVSALDLWLYIMAGNQPTKD